MHMPIFQKIQLDISISIEHLVNAFGDVLGFVFLQDNHQPVIGIYPKLYWSAQIQDSNCYIRLPDFNYTNDEQPLHLTFDGKNNNKNGFSGGYISFISYDYASIAHQHTHQNYSAPSFLIGEYDIFFKKENLNWVLYIDEKISETLIVQKIINQVQNLESYKSQDQCKFKTAFQPRWSKSEYKNAFTKVQNYLYAGDCYQINLTQEFSTKIQYGKLLSLLPELQNLTQAPYAGYIAFKDFELLSCSPELFIEFDTDRLLKTRPIKGTLPRGVTSSEDEKLKQQ